MYSPECKKCVVVGCPDDCSVKRKYFKEFVHVTRCEFCKYFREYTVYDSSFPKGCCCVDSEGLRYVFKDGYCEKGAPKDKDKD